MPSRGLIHPSHALWTEPTIPFKSEYLMSQAKEYGMSKVGLYQLDTVHIRSLTEKFTTVMKVDEGILLVNQRAFLVW